MPLETPIPVFDAYKLCQKLWAFAQKRALHDKDLSAVLDILKHQMNQDFLTTSHAKAGAFVLGRHGTNPFDDKA